MTSYIYLEEKGVIVL